MSVASLRFGIDLPSSGPALLAERPRRAPGAAAAVLPLAKAPPEILAAVGEGARATAALPFGTALLVPLAAPPLSPAKVRQVLPSLLAANLPFPLSECVHAFERAPTGRLFAHVVRRADLDARLAELREHGCDPVRIVPPGPALWRAAWGRAAGSDGGDAPRAVLFAGPDRSLLVTGRGPCPDAVAVFRSDAPAEPLRRLRLAFGGLPEGLRVLVAGPGHAAAVAALGDAVRADVPPEPEAFLSRALAAPGLEDLNLRIGTVAHRSASRPLRPLRAAATAFVLCSAFAAVASGVERARAFRALDAAEAAWTQAVNTLAGGPVPGLRGAGALAYARAEAAAFAPPRDLPATAPSDFLRAARGAEVRLDGFELSPAGVLAEGSAPSPDARAAFLDALRSAGFAFVAEDRPSKDGRAAFALKPPAAP